MKVKLAIIVVALAAIAAGSVWMTSRPSETVRLVPAWQLTTEKTYDAEQAVDPVISWSPDSKSALFAASGFQARRTKILRWKVGAKSAESVEYGVCANYINNDEFMFFRSNPNSIFKKSFKGKEVAIVPTLNKLDVWRDMTGISYVPDRKTIQLRLSEFTRFYEPGCVEIDLAGKNLGRVPRTTGGGLLDISLSSDGQKSAAIVGELTGTERALVICPKGDELKSKGILTGKLGAVAWSPDGRVIALAEENAIKAIDPATLKIVTIARFGQPSDESNPPYISRLVWSPDSKYLAAMQLVPDGESVYEMLYALDMSKLKW